MDFETAEDDGSGIFSDMIDSVMSLPWDEMIAQYWRPLTLLQKVRLRLIDIATGQFDIELKSRGPKVVLQF